MIFEKHCFSAHVALGSNQGDRQAILDEALKLIDEIPDTRVDRRSDPVETPAQEKNAGQAAFLNQVIRIETRLQPTDLLEKLQIIERRLGRTSKGDNAPRTVDLDLLTYGDVVMRGRNLALPHPRLTERLFVLEPLNQIDPDWKHPKLGKTAHELLDQLKSKDEVGGMK